MPQNNVLYKTLKCYKDKCNGANLVIRLRKRDKDAKHRLLSWRCQNCGTFSSLFNDIFLELLGMPLYETVRTIQCWAIRLSINKTVDILELEKSDVCRHTVGTYFNPLRNVCSIALNKKEIKLSGDGKIVEIDESQYAKTKYNRGSDLKRKQVWVYGLVDRKNGNCFMQVLPDRAAAT